MAIPTIQSITPNQGHTGGRTLVVITGTNFRLPDPPAPTGIVPAFGPTVRVQFDGEDAEDIEVFSDTEIQCITPAVRTAQQMGVKLPSYNPEQLVTLTITNLDNAGAAIPTETVALTAAFQYRLPNPAIQSLTAKVMRAFIQDLVRQVHPNVAFTTNTDYDPATGDLLQLAAFASLPAIVIGDLNILTARGRREQQPEVVPEGVDRFVERRPPEIVDFTFSITAVSDDAFEILNLAQMLVMYFARNAYLRVPRTDSPTAERVKYPLRKMTDTSPAAVTNLGDGSNVESCTLQASITDVRLEDFPGLPSAGPAAIVGAHEGTKGWGYVAEEVLLDTQVDDSEGS